MHRSANVELSKYAKQLNQVLGKTHLKLPFVLADDQYSVRVLLISSMPFEVS